MLRKLISIFVVAILAVSSVACKSDTPKETISGNNQTKEETSEITGDSTINNEEPIYIVEGASIEDSGITQTIKEVRVFDNMTDAIESYGQSTLVVNDENKDKVTVVVKFEIKNSNDFMICTYPSQATFITNSGEQVEADLWASESFDGEIYEGVTKEGHVLFNLDKTSIDDLGSFKMVWSTNHENGTSDNYDDDYYIDNKLEVVLK